MKRSDIVFCLKKYRDYSWPELHSPICELDIAIA